MADPTDDDDDADLVPIKRQPKMLSQRKSLPSVDGALDDFIVSANQKLLDVTEFTAENREQQLRGEIAELEKKLAAAQKRIENHVDAPPPEPIVKRPWGMVIAAFIVGGGIAFGAAKAMQPAAAKEPVASRDCPAVPAAPPADQGNQPSQVASPATPQAPQQAAAVTPTPAQPPATPATPAAPTTTVAAKQAPKQPKSPKTSAAATTHAEEHHDAAQTPKATSDTKPPPAQDGSGSDLYNPF